MFESNQFQESSQRFFLSLYDASSCWLVMPCSHHCVNEAAVDCNTFARMFLNALCTRGSCADYAYSTFLVAQAFQGLRLHLGEGLGTCTARIEHGLVSNTFNAVTLDRIPV
jgi:hypothetical protein